MHGANEKSKLYLLFFVKSWIEAAVLGTMIFYVSVYIVSRSTSPYSSDMGMMMLMVIYSIILTFNLRIFFSRLDSKNLIYILTEFFSLGALVKYNKKKNYFFFKNIFYFMIHPFYYKFI